MKCTPKLQQLMRKVRQNNGFTLIEMSIVLVIIGLIVGSVLAGQDLIHSASVRATISQIEKYNVAANTFKGKYGLLPGDVDTNTANQFGFTSRTYFYFCCTGVSAPSGLGDGNNLIEGNVPAGGTCYYQYCSSGFAQNCETLYFWQDLSVGNPASPMNINLIDGTFKSVPAGSACSGFSVTGATIANYLPRAKIGRGNYVYVFSTNGLNYFGISAMTAIAITTGAPTATADLSPQMAYAIDKKVDDGFPTTGIVMATLVNGVIARNTPIGSSSIMSPHTSSPPSATDCYDSAGVSYAISVNNNGVGAVDQCALSFQFMQ